MKCQFDAFADYVAEAGREGASQYPLYEWTKETSQIRRRCTKYLKSFTLRVKEKEVYPKNEADALEADLQSLAVITRISKHDTDPEHNPQMPERYRKEAGEATPNT
jgi:hypothetical protein